MFRQRDEFLCRQYGDRYGRNLNRFNGTRKVSIGVFEGAPARTYERQRTRMFLLMRGFLAKLDIESVNKKRLFRITYYNESYFFFAFDILDRDVTINPTKFKNRP